MAGYPNLLQIFIYIIILLHMITAESVISFVAVGDWGGLPYSPYYTAAQASVSAAMNDVAGKIGSSFVVALGDNYYYNGVDDVDSSRFVYTWDDVYTGSNLQTPWYVLAGNHDHYGNVSAQVAYSETSDRWIFPNLYHSHSFAAADGSFTVDLIMIDTVELAGMFHYDENHPNYFDKLPRKPREYNLQQWLWIEEQLRTSTADYLLVMGHYPVYSVCSHGNTETLIYELLPLLEKYGAHYVSGHDHCMDHIKETDSSVQHYLVGMGVECCYDSDNIDSVPADSLQWYIASDNKGSVEGGFASFTLSAASMTITYYDESGNVLYTAPSVASREISTKRTTER